jgi:bifunctional non-homologous end joining protein LigD
MSVNLELRPSFRSFTCWQPCLPRLAKRPPNSSYWIHEIKQDGFRILAQKEGDRVRLMTRHGYDCTNQYPLALAAVSALPARSCVIDNEIIVCNEDGLAVYDLLRARTHDHLALLCAFDLIELDGADLRSIAIEDRKQRLAWLLRSPHDGIAMNRHYDEDGAMVYKEACAYGCDGIVSKRRGSPYSAGRSSHWLRVKNPKASAAKRMAAAEAFHARFPSGSV